MRDAALTHGSVDAPGGVARMFCLALTFGAPGDDPRPPTVAGDVHRRPTGAAMKRLAMLAATALSAAASIVAGCGGSSGRGSAAKPVDPNGPEVSPAGDIPDNQAFVVYAPAGWGLTVKVPEGWARTTTATAATFTDKLNSVAVQKPSPAAKAPTIAGATSSELPRLAGTVKGFAGGRAAVVRRTAGRALRITFLASSPPDAVTGRTHRNAVERYEFFRSGKRAVLTLAGPRGADNVDPWRIVTDSLHWTR
jgi:hypothetical protein